MKCPDCGTEIKEVVVERFQTQKFKVDHANQEVSPVFPDGEWDLANDYAYHCPACDSLNVDEMLSKYKLKGVK